MEQTQPMPRPIDYTVQPRKSVSSYFNPRMIAFALVIGAIFGIPAYIYLDHAMNQGIRQGADGYTEVDLKALSTFPFDQSLGTLADVPERFRALDGKKVVLVGEMYSPVATGPDVERFDLVYSISKCCNVGAPQIQHFVKSKAVAGTVPFYGGPVKARGTLRVNVTHEDGRVTSVYHFDVESIEPV